MPMLKWSPTIEAGHILQALTIAGGIAAGAFSGYLTVMHLDATTEVKLALIFQRLDQDEVALGQIRSNEQSFHDKLDDTLDKMKAQVNELVGSFDRRHNDH